MIWAFVCATLVLITSADVCRNLCKSVPSACSRGRSYCKHDDVCHDLYWYDSRTLCNRSETKCPSKHVVTCAQAERLSIALATSPPDWGMSGSFVGYDPVRNDMTPKMLGTKGFRNLSNTCYLGSALLLLTRSRFLRFILGRTSRFRRNTSELEFRLFLLFEHQWSGGGSEMNPWLIIDYLQEATGGFPLGSLEDAHEALRALLGLMDGRVDSVFSSRVTRARACGLCTHLRSVDDTVQDLFLPVPEVEEGVVVDLEACLALYVASETVEGVECENGCVASADFSTGVFNLAPALLIPLMRFNMLGEKIKTRVKIPQFIDFKTVPNWHSNDVYDLVAVVNHVGDAPDDGHYVTDFVHESVWMRADDEHTSLAKESPTNDAGSVEAYLLLYERRHM